MGVGSNGYYSLREILGYNAIINIVLSDRGRGKSYGTKLFLMEQEGTFMCVYRQQPDMAHAMQDWLDPLLENGYSPESFEWEGSDKEGWVLKYNGVKKAWFRYLTAVNHIKQEKFPDNMNWIWFDEFIPLKYAKLSGIDSEGDALRTIMKTIDHDSVHSREEKGLKPLRVLMYANPFTWNNPLLSYFKVVPRFGIHRVGPGIVCEYLEPLDPEEAKTQTEKMNCFLGDEVNQNQGWMDEHSFIEKPPKGSEPRMSLRLGDYYFHIYFTTTGRYVQGAKAHHKSKDIDRYGTFKGLREDEVCIEDSAKVKMLQNMCYKGMFRYDNINTKFEFIQGIALNVR